MPFSTDDTIVAIATPPGRGGIGVVRLSGPLAVRVAHTLLGREDPLEPRHATFGRVVEPVRDRHWPCVDEVVATWFQAPRSYTGDDVVEISGHGSPILLERVVSLSIAAGARLAEPGEFTLRAYLNGRLDLIQAEAVADLIEAVTPLQARAAMDQLEGTLTGAITKIDATLFDLVARLEASLDFPDEGFHFVTREDAAVLIAEASDALAGLVDAGRAGRVVRDGRLVVFAGRPNTGKSSVFNALIGSARAIVTDIPGTTRDLLTERVDILGVPVTLVDTAGARDAVDAIEAEGIARALQAREVAALVLVVLDGSCPLTADDHRLLRETTSRPSLVVVNKTDLPSVWSRAAIDSDRRVVHLSSLTGDGLDALRRALIDDVLDRVEDRDQPFVSNMRHVGLMEVAMAGLVRATAAMEAGVTEELLLVDLNDARRALEEIRGHRTADDLLRHIFARFCIGK
jgi:tRNA modification GTPase